MAEIILDLVQQYRENPAGSNRPKCRFKKIIDGKLLYNQKKEIKEDISTDDNENSQQALKSENLDKTVEKKVEEKMEREIKGVLTKDDLNKGGRVDFN